jgi:mRNA interferase MazF
MRTGQNTLKAITWRNGSEEARPSGSPSFPNDRDGAGQTQTCLAHRTGARRHGDWLVSMISTQVQQAVDGFDEIIGIGDSDFRPSGLKVESVLRIGRLAVVPTNQLLGAIGEIDGHRLLKIRKKLAGWIGGEL